MDELCTTCLCRGRKLFTLEKTGLYEIILPIFNELQLTDGKIECVHICWECLAKLKNWHRFRSQAQNSYKLLLEYIPQSSPALLSCTALSIHHISNISYTDETVKAENILTEDDIKSEVDELEHCEPETFVNEITVERPKRKRGKEKTPKKAKKKLKAEKSETTCKMKYIKDEDHQNSHSPIDDCDNGLDYEENVKVDVENHLDKYVVVDNENDEKIKTSEKTLPALVPYSTLSIQHITNLVIDQMVKTKDGCDPNTPVKDGSMEKPKRKKSKQKIPPKLKKKIKVEKSKSTCKKKMKHKSPRNSPPPIDDDINDCNDSLDEAIDQKLDDKNGVENHLDEFADVDKHKTLEKFTESKNETVKLVFANKKMIGDKPQCAECGKVFSSKKTLRYHWNVLHKGQNRYPCPICGKVYQWKSNLGRHLRSHKARDSGELYCELCDKRFASVATYKQHLRVSRRHVSESEFSFMCNECGKKFVSKTRLRDHIDWEHLKRIKFRCKLCHKPFKCHTSLYVHMQNVHANKEKDLCHVCGKAYQNAAKLKYHIVAMHTDETPYECVHCRVSFGWYSSLYRHVREVHHKMKLQPKKSSKKSKKLEMLPSLMSHQQPPMHLPGPA